MSCKHHWMIEPANGPTAHGFCKECGEERDFTTVALPRERGYKWPEGLGPTFVVGKEERKLGRVIGVI